MRSELVYEASKQVINRFLLAKVTMSAAKKLHIASTRTEDTVNGVLRDIGHGMYTDFKLAQPVRVLDTIDTPLLSSVILAA